MCAMNCPSCQAELRLIFSRRIGGGRLYAWLFLYECPSHGMIFRTLNGLRSDDDDSTIVAPRKPVPTLNAGAISLPEPD